MQVGVIDPVKDIEEVQVKIPVLEEDHLSLNTLELKDYLKVVKLALSDKEKGSMSRFIYMEVTSGGSLLIRVNGMDSYIKFSVDICNSANVLQGSFLIDFDSLDNLLAYTGTYVLLSKGEDCLIMHLPNAKIPLQVYTFNSVFYKQIDTVLDNVVFNEVDASKTSNLKKYFTIASESFKLSDSGKNLKTFIKSGVSYMNFGKALMSILTPLPDVSLRAVDLGILSSLVRENEPFYYNFSKKEQNLFKYKELVIGFLKVDTKDLLFVEGEFSKLVPVQSEEEPKYSVIDISILKQSLGILKLVSSSTCECSLLNKDDVSYLESVNVFNKVSSFVLGNPIEGTIKLPYVILDSIVSLYKDSFTFKKIGNSLYFMDSLFQGVVPLANE